jgi:hypothetical protein
MPYYWAWHWCGYRGIYLIAVGMIEALAAGCCILGWQRTGNVRPAILASCIFVLLATVSLGPRTQMFGWACLICELIVLQEFTNGKDYLWTLPPLFALWVNLHGSWPVGILFLVVFAAARWTGISWGAIYSEGLPIASRNRLLWVLVFSIAALFINPYVWRLVIYPFVITTQHHLTTNTVEEWQSLDFHSFRGRLLFVVVAGLIWINMVRRRRWQLDELVFATISILAAVSYSRFLLLAGIVLTPYIAREFAFFEQENWQTDKPYLNALIMGGLAVFLISSFPDTSTLRKQSEEGFPVKALAYLSATPSSEPTMNDFNWGGYLLWNIPNTRVFIDSRADVFEQWGVFGDYMEAVKLEDPHRIIVKYGIRRVVFRSHEPLILLLKQTPGWKVEYEDETATVMHNSIP